MIAGDDFARFAPRLAAGDAARWAALLSAQAQASGIDTPRRIAHWMAQMSVECAGFTRLVEDLDYSAQALTAIWPGRFGPALARTVERDPERIANLAYAGRFGNGDAASGDGWRFRGRGPLMRTFRDGYATAARDTGLDLLANPDLLETPDAGARDAAAFWTRRRINPLADADDLAAVTRAVNGGLTGLGQRREALNRARAIWSD